jgi:hypothetical protein
VTANVKFPASESDAMKLSDMLVNVKLNMKPRRLGVKVIFDGWPDHEGVTVTVCPERSLVADSVNSPFWFTKTDAGADADAKAVSTNETDPPTTETGKKKLVKLPDIDTAMAQSCGVVDDMLNVASMPVPTVDSVIESGAITAVPQVGVKMTDDPL